MEDPDAFTLENRGEGSRGLVRPYVAGQGYDTDRSPDAMAGNDEVSPWDGYFFAPPGPAADLNGLRRSGPIVRADRSYEHPTRVLADRPAATPPGRRAGGSRSSKGAQPPKGSQPSRGSRPPAGRGALRRSLALIAVLGAAAVAGIVYLAFPSHLGSTPMAGCKAPGCHGASSATSGAQPQQSLYVHAHSTMSMPAAHAAPPRSASPVKPTGNAANQASTSGTRVSSPSTTSTTPSLAPGSVISIEATTACCTTFSIRHDAGDSRVVIAQVTSGSSQTTRDDATWIVRDGLADSACVSFESANAPGAYLWHHNFELFLGANDGSTSFADYATFCPHPGNSGQGYSFEAFNRPDNFIRHFDYVVYLASDGGLLPWDTKTLWYDDTSWRIIQPWS